MKKEILFATMLILSSSVQASLIESSKIVGERFAGVREAVIASLKIKTNAEMQQAQTIVMFTASIVFAIAALGGAADIIKQKVQNKTVKKIAGLISDTSTVSHLLGLCVASYYFAKIGITDYSNNK